MNIIFHTCSKERQDNLRQNTEIQYKLKGDLAGRLLVYIIKKCTPKGRPHLGMNRFWLDIFR